MGQTERLAVFIEFALDILGISSVKEPDDKNNWDQSRPWYHYQAMVKSIRNLVEDHGKAEEKSDTCTRSIADQYSDLRSLADCMEVLRNSLENFPDDSKSHLWGLGFEFSKGLDCVREPSEMDAELVLGNLPPLLPELQRSLAGMARLLVERADELGVSKGTRAVHPDRILVSRCLDMSDQALKSKEDGYRLARKAYWASTGVNPSEEWRRSQLRERA